MFVTSNAGEKMQLAGEAACFVGQPSPGDGMLVVYSSAMGKARFSNTITGPLTVNGALTVGGAVSGAGFTALFASPPPLGSTVPNTIKGTTGEYTGFLWSTGDGATKVGFLDAASAANPDTYVGLRYDSANNRAELAALSGGVAWRSVYVGKSASLVADAITVNVPASGTWNLLNASNSAATGAVFVQLQNAGSALYLGKENSTGSVFGIPAYASVIGNSNTQPLCVLLSGVVVAQFNSTGHTLTASTAGAHDFAATAGARIQMFGGTHASSPKQLYIDADTLYFRNVAGTSRATLDSTGLAVTNGFGCNGKSPQAAYASGGVLAQVVAALIANGILSS